MQQAFEGRVEIIGVAGRDEITAMESFVSDLGVDGFPHIVDLELEIWTRYDVASQPSFVFIDDDGSVETVLGAMGADALTSRVDALLSSSLPTPRGQRRAPGSASCGFSAPHPALPVENRAKCEIRGPFSRKC